MAESQNILTRLRWAALGLLLILSGATATFAAVAQADSPNFTLNTTTIRPGVGGTGQADSPNFTLDTRGTVTGVGGSSQGDSSNFTLDTRGFVPGFGGTGQADSPNFTLDTRAPTILTQPQDQTVNSGRNATFAVTAAYAVSYQWRFNGVAIAGATASMYVRTNAQPADAGPYTVVVSNSFGSLTSAVAVLTVIPSPPGVIAQWNFNSQPSDANAATGTTEPVYGSGTAALVGGTTATFVAGDSLDTASVDDNSAWDTTHYPTASQQNKTRGVQFNASTTGMKNIRVSWRANVTPNASKWVRLQYATNGTFLDFPTATAMSASGVFESKSNNLAAISGVNNNANFAFRIVAEFESTAAGTANAQYVTTAGGGYSMSGDILFDLVTVYGDNTNPVPATLTTPGFAFNNDFQFTVTGQTGANYAIQASTNLSTTNWTWLRTNAAPFTFVDSNAVFYPQRFYRAVFLP